MPVHIFEKLCQVYSEVCLASRMRKFFSWLDKAYWNENVIWSPGYFVSSVGLNEDVIRNYVVMQGQQDSGQLKLEL